MPLLSKDYKKRDADVFVIWKKIGIFYGIANKIYFYIFAFFKTIDMNCPKCCGFQPIKSGKIKGRQRYKCKGYRFKKNYCWKWIAVDRYGKRFIDFVIGDRGNETAETFWEKIKRHEMNCISSDYWKSYEHITPPDKHVQSKKEAFTIEGYNSLFRHFLARMKRRSKCYSKKIEMLAISILLLMHYKNNSLSIFY